MLLILLLQKYTKKLLWKQILPRYLKIFSEQGSREESITEGHIF